MQPELLNQLQNEIHNKCVAYDYNDATDSTLSEFIINLIQVNKSAQEVNDELVNLVGSDYDTNVTEWIFTRKNELENTQLAAAPVEEPQEQEQEQEQQQQHQEDESMDIASKTVRPDRENRIFSKAIGSVIGHVNRPERSSAFSSQPRRSDRSRSRSRSPERRPSRYEQDRYISRHEDRHSTRHDDRYSTRHEGDRLKSSNIFSRLGHSTKTSSRTEEDRPSVFDRLGGSKPIPTTQNNHDSKSERCKYWPNCKNGDECIYHHPTTVCPDFPNCPKTTIECMFIHPEVAKPIAMQPQVKKLPVPCKFFPYCTNPLCPYMHPVMPPHQPFFMQAKPSFATTGQRVQVPCKNGDACTRPDCHFLHPRDPNPQSEVICKFDGACTRPNCFYKHTKENTINKVFINKESTNERQFSVAEDEVIERIPVGDSADMISNGQQQEQQQMSVMDMDSDVVMDAN